MLAIVPAHGHSVPSLMKAALGPRTAGWAPFSPERQVQTGEQASPDISDTN